MLVTHSFQPLSVGEVREAIASRLDCKDYATDRMPSAQMIEKLCYPLIEFKYPSDKSDEPILQPYHAAVKEFFRQDPKTNGIENDLHFFFVNAELANRDIGTRCLSYLLYRRYRKDISMEELLCNNAVCQHAFLKYAAVYWFRHLTFGHHDQQLFDNAEKFIRSPNFWTCVQVQQALAPHLFAKLVKRGSNSYMICDSHSSSGRNDHEALFSTPIPGWIHTYGDRGAQIAQQLLSWVKEWHHILAYPHTQNPYFDPTVIGSPNIFSPLGTKHAHAHINAVEQVCSDWKSPYSNKPNPDTTEDQKVNGSMSFTSGPSSSSQESLHTFSSLCSLKDLVESVVHSEESAQALSTASFNNTIRCQFDTQHHAKEVSRACTPADATVNPSVASFTGHEAEARQIPDQPQTIVGIAQTYMSSRKELVLVSRTYRTADGENLLKNGSIPDSIELEETDSDDDESTNNSDSGYDSDAGNELPESDDESEVGIEYRLGVFNHKGISGARGAKSDQDSDIEDDLRDPEG